MTLPLDALLGRLPALFPQSAPLVLRASAGAFAADFTTRFSGGHAARWFAAVDGQEGDEPFADAHALCSLAEALDVMRIADGLRAEPDGYWVESHWLAIASDGAGQHLMIDDRDGRVLAVAHDDDHVGVVAPSVEAWLEHLVEGHASGSVVHDDVFGLIDAAELRQIHDARQAQADRQRPVPLSARQRVGLALAGVGMATVIAAVIWFFERGR